MTENAKRQSVAELRARVAGLERELHGSIEQIGDAVEEALDWKKKFREHPLESAALALVAGFLVTQAPGALPRLAREVGTAGLRTAAGTGGGALLNGLISRFIKR